MPSINNEHDAAISSTACLPTLKGQLDAHGAFLVCCYSHHPLVAQIRKVLSERGQHSKLVTGIFEASVASCLQLLNQPGEKFGIVSTGAQWEEILDLAVRELLGTEASARYAGTETTGMNADELHVLPKEDVDAAMKEATKRLLRKGAGAICLGCAGMVGLEVVVREACVEELGEGKGREVRVVDGVVAGVAFLEVALRAGQ